MDEISEKRVSEAEALASELRGLLDKRFERLEARFSNSAAATRKDAEQDERLSTILGRIEAVEQRLYRVEQEAATSRRALGDMAQHLETISAGLEKLARRSTRR